MKNNLTKSAEVFKALGDPTRLKITKIIFASQNVCVGMIAKNLSITQPAVSQHLKILKNAGLVNAQKIGYHVHYSLNAEQISLYVNNYKQLIGQIEVEPCTECPDDIN
jgi:DNA-binding transcriptional ArsR family regulator